MAKKRRTQKAPRRTAGGRHHGSERRGERSNGLPSGGFRAFVGQVWRNRAGTIGFLLSLLQLVLYGAMFAIMTMLVQSGQAKDLDEGSAASWIVVGLLFGGLLTTAVALFLSLYGAIRGTPKTLAIVGLCLSFFVGATVTFVLLIGALNAGGG